MSARWFLTTFFGMSLLFLCAARSPGGDDLAQAELKKLEGTWQVTSGERNGMPTERIVGDTLTFSGEEFTVQHDGNERFKATIKLYPDKKPREIDATVTEGEDKGKTALGIYALEGDELKLCFDPPGGGARPKEFASPEGSDYMVVVLKRQKK
jgi:uncharacterized protein (TIGR03067 family)